MGDNRLAYTAKPAASLAPSKEVSLRHSSVGTRIAALGAVALFAAACPSLSTTRPTGLCSKVGIFTVGDTTRDSLATDDCTQSDGTYIDFWGFDADTQVNLRFHLSSPSNLAILELFDSRGAIIANSYVQGAVDTASTMRVMVDSGSYAISVRGTASGGRGPYRLVAVNDTAAVGGCTYVWVTPGITTAQTITNANACTAGPGGAGYNYHVYTIVLLQNETLDITEHTTAFAPYVALLGSSVSSSSSVDSTGTNAFISFITSAQGAYQIWAGSSETNALGQYTITLH
jgi:hypothetical protein